MAQCDAKDLLVVKVGTLRMLQHTSRHVARKTQSGQSVLLILQSI